MKPNHLNKLPNMFKQLITWSKLTISQRYNFIMGLIIVVLGMTIVKQKAECKEERAGYRAEKKDLQEKIDLLKENHLLYLQKIDNQYRDLLLKSIENNHYEDN